MGALKTTFIVCPTRSWLQVKPIQYRFALIYFELIILPRCQRITTSGGGGVVITVVALKQLYPDVAGDIDIRCRIRLHLKSGNLRSKNAPPL